MERLATTRFPNNEVRIRAKTARRWLDVMGFEFGEHKKDVFYDGHEREVVVAYRQHVFFFTAMDEP